MIMLLAIAHAVSGPPDYKETLTSVPAASHETAAKERAELVCGTKDPDIYMRVLPAVGPDLVNVELSVWCKPKSGDPPPPPPPPPPQSGSNAPLSCPRLYDDANYTGGFTEVCHTVDHLNLNADKASSIRVPSGWTVRVCQGPFGQGACSTLGNHPDLRFSDVGEDTISYVAVINPYAPPSVTAPNGDTITWVTAANAISPGASIPVSFHKWPKPGKTRKVPVKATSTFTRNYSQTTKYWQSYDWRLTRLVNDDGIQLNVEMKVQLINVAGGETGGNPHVREPEFVLRLHDVTHLPQAAKPAFPEVGQGHATYRFSQSFSESEWKNIESNNPTFKLEFHSFSP